MQHRLPVARLAALGLVAVLALGCGSGDPARCGELVTRICEQRRGCTGQDDRTCAQEVARLIPCAQDATCAGRQFNPGAVDQCLKDQEMATCQDVAAGKIATSCTQTCR